MSQTLDDQISEELCRDWPKLYDYETLEIIVVLSGVVGRWIMGGNEKKTFNQYVSESFFPPRLAITYLNISLLNYSLATY